MAVSKTSFDVDQVILPERYDDDDVCEKVSLAELSRTIAPLLTAGILEFVSTGHSYSKVIVMRTLAVHSDGRVQLSIQTYESDPRDKWHTCSTETFPPGVVTSEDMKLAREQFEARLEQILLNKDEAENVSLSGGERT
jgi:hypothetical protein